jgi:UPF0755 protein
VIGPDLYSFRALWRHDCNCCRNKRNTFNEMRAAIGAHPKLVHTLKGLDRHAIGRRMGMSTDPEGFLFPDTYYFTAGTTDLDLLRQAYQRMVKKLAQIKATHRQTLIFRPG